MAKLQSKTKLRSQSRNEERWTARTWYEIAMMLETASGNLNLPKKLRNQLGIRAEAAWITGDLMNGITPEMWAEECRKEDEAFAARLRGEDVKLPSELAEEKHQTKRANYSVRNRSEKKAVKPKANKKGRASQLQLEFA